MPRRAKEHISHSAPAGVFSKLTTQWRGVLEGVVFLTSAAMFWAGCTSTSLVAEKPQPLPPLISESRLVIELDNGNSIDLAPYHFVDVRDPEDFVFGTGRKINLVTGESGEFNGRIDTCAVTRRDTMEQAGWMSYRASNVYDFIIDDSTIVRFKAGDFVTVKSGGGTGLWITGLPHGAETSLSSGRKIDFTSITKVEEKSASPVKTVLCVLGISVGIAYIIMRLVGSDIAASLNGQDRQP